MAITALNYFYTRLGTYLFTKHIPSTKEIREKNWVLDIPEHSGSWLLPVKVYPVDAKGKKDFSKPFEMKNKRLTGAYIVTDTYCYVISTVSLNDFEHIKFIDLSDSSDDEESIGGRLRIIKWLVEEAVFPCMVGLFGNKSPIQSFRVSESEDVCFFCSSNEENFFSLRTVREHIDLLNGFKWSDFEKAYDLRMKFIDPDTREDNFNKYLKLVEKSPELVKAVASVTIVRGSIEWSFVNSYLKLNGV